MSLPTGLVEALTNVIFQAESPRPLSVNENYSVSTSIQDIPRRLRPVSAQPVIKFPTDDIFQVEQCLEPYASENKCKSKGPDGSVTLTNVPSSVVSEANDYDENEAEEEPAIAMGVADAVRLPIDATSSKTLCFSEALVVSRMIEIDESTNQDGPLSAVRSDQKLHPLLKVDRLVPMGGMAINIEELNDKFVINSATQFSFESESTATATIQAEYTKMMEVEYEKRCETLCNINGNMVFSGLK